MLTDVEFIQQEEDKMGDKLFYDIEKNSNAKERLLAYAEKFKEKKEEKKVVLEESKNDAI